MSASSCLLTRESPLTGMCNTEFDWQAKWGDEKVSTRNWVAKRGVYSLEDFFEGGGGFKKYILSS